MQRVLIVEDNKSISSIYMDMYRMAGFEVEVAEDGEVGLQKVEEFKPDLLHLDLMIPKIDGFEVIRRLRAQPQWQSLPILVLSVSYAPDAMNGALQIGATQVLSKAKCSPKAVVTAARQLLARPAQSVPAAAPPAPAQPPQEAIAEPAAPADAPSEASAPGDSPEPLPPGT